MSLVSQNSRRRRRRCAKATAQNGRWGETQAPNAPELPAAVTGPDVPQGPNEPQILQGFNASEGPGTSVPPTSGEGPSTSVPFPATEGSGASGQFTTSEGPNTSELPIPSELPNISGPPTVSEGLNGAMSITASQGPRSLVPPAALDGPIAQEHPTVREELNTSELPLSEEGLSTSVPPPSGEVPSTSVLPTDSEGPGTSVPPPPSGDRPSCSEPATLGEGLNTSEALPEAEGLGINAPPSSQESPRSSMPSTPGEGLSISMLSTDSQGPGISVPPPSGEDPSTTGLPTASEGASALVQPPSSEGRSISMPPTGGEGLGTCALPSGCESRGICVLRIPHDCLISSVTPPSGEGPSAFLLPADCEVLDTCALHPCGEGRHNYVSHIPEEVPCTSRMPTAAEDPSISGMPTACENPDTLLSLSAMGPNSSKASPRMNRISNGAEGPLGFQVLRDRENSNCITIMGLGTGQVVLTLKPQDPMEHNVAELLQFLLVKDQSKYPIRESEMREFIAKECRSQFPEILRQAADRLECIFRFELKELDPEECTYLLLNKLGPVPFDGLEDRPNGPKMGLLMLILGQILLNGNQAKEAEIWEMLWRLGVQRERRLSIFGNPKRLLSVEFVWQRYLDYRPITDCSPVEYEFFWGPRSHVETTKMKILKFMAKIYNKDPRDWPEQYHEALEEEAIRAAGGDWPAVHHYRRPYFEEAAAEIAIHDADISGYSSKYAPHTWPETRLESKSRKLVQLFLLMDATKLPIPKKGILYYIGRECSKVFPDLLNRAARTLNHVYGTELVVLDPRNHSYTLYNRREMEDTEEIMDSPNRPGNNFLMQVLSFIFIMGNHARESAVWAFLRGLGVQSGRKHAITCRYLSQRYIDSLRVPDSDPVQYDFVWGPRARLETSKMKALRYVARIHRKDPQEWPEQYREALEDEANRADAAHRQFLVHNF
ncbi:melanoma-associated antigen E1 [Perognathus longimembris pacificus]|uniref:melanoma-associated antigen E1 n=1 Tax=Perognathus longimembris pacificus TaxID=214514 RepID=UPI00201922A0|nr:melanoma-associated antigen E1 [Perognathus longimembris pacificus]